MVGLTSLVIKDLGNILKQSEKYMEQYGDQIAIDTTTSDFSIEKDKYILIQHSRNNGDTECNTSHKASITFPTNVLALVSFHVYSRHRSFALLGYGNADIQGFVSGMLPFIFKANQEYAIVATCGIWGSSSSDGQFNANIFIFPLDWW